MTGPCLNARFNTFSNVDSLEDPLGLNWATVYFETSPCSFKIVRYGGERLASLSLEVYFDFPLTK